MKNMKVVIAAAGMGTRLLPVTESTPKCLLDINGKAIIDYYFETLHRLGFAKSDIAIIVGFQKDKIKKHLGDGYIYVDNDEYAASNSMYSFYLARDFMGDNDILYIESDLFFHPDILKNCLLLGREENYLVVDREKWTDESMRVKITDDCLDYAGKQIPDNECDGDWIGIARIKRETLSDLFRMIEKTLAERGKNVYLELGGFNPLVKETAHKFKISPTGGLPWIEIDFEHELETARKEICPAIYGKK